MSNLGVRNNNWLNIRYNPNNDWVGQTGGDKNNYAQFEDPIYGLRAADRVLENYGKKHGINNLNSEDICLKLMMLAHNVDSSF